MARIIQMFLDSNNPDPTFLSLKSGSGSVWAAEKVQNRGRSGLQLLRPPQQRGCGPKKQTAPPTRSDITPAAKTVSGRGVEGGEG